MTETLGSATLVISTDDRKMRAGIRDARQRARKLGQDMGRVGRKMSTAITLPVLGLGAAILKSAADFETGMNSVQAVTQATGEDFARLEDLAKELGATTKFSASEAAEGMVLLGQAGFDTEQIVATMPATLNLAAASGDSLADTADRMTNVMAGFGLGAKEAGRAADVLTKASISSNTSVADIAEAMSFAGPVLKAFGIGFEESAAAVGILGDNGIKASRAGTALSGALVRLANPAKDNAELMERLGINVLDSAGNMLPLVEIIKQLEASGASASEMMQIFGQRAGPAMLALVDKGSGALAELTEKIEESGGTAQDVAQTKMKGLSGALDTLKAAMEAVAIAIGESGLLEWVTDAAKATADWFRELAKTNPAILKWGVILVGLGAVIGPLLISLGLLATAILAISTPVLIVIGILLAVGGAVWAFWKFRNEIAAAVESAFKAVKKWLQDAMAAVFDWVMGKIDALIAAWRALVSFITGSTISASGVSAGDPFFDGPGTGALSATEAIVNAPGGVPASIIQQQAPRQITIQVGDDDLLDGSGLRRLVERINDEMADDATQLQVQTI